MCQPILRLCVICMGMTILREQMVAVSVSDRKQREGESGRKRDKMVTSNHPWTSW